MYYTIYKTINKINGKFYIGAHATSNINDGYLGSGTSLLHAMKKYGKISKLDSVPDGWHKGRTYTKKIGMICMTSY